MANLGNKWAIALPPYHEKLFLCWAYSKGVSKTALAQNTLQSRVEANELEIIMMVEERAEEWDCSMVEAQARILAAMGYEPSNGGDKDE